MLEVCFSDSVKGAISYAQHCNSNSAGAIGVITDKKGIFAFFEKRRAVKEYKKRKKELQKIAVPLGGKREDIIGISFDLSQDDISSEICLENCPRKDFIRSIYSFDRHNIGIDMEESIGEFWSNCIDDLEKIKSYPPEIRVWLDSTPEAQCGLLFLADLLKESQTVIHIVELPKQIVREDNTIIEYRGWGEIEPERYGTFINGQRVLSRKNILDLANRWQQLKSENSPLRVIENGLIISADINYYDDLIRKEFPKDSCGIAYIIGRGLGKQKIPTGDVFIAKRIQEFIRVGELEVISNYNDEFYSTIVKCPR